MALEALRELFYGLFTTLAAHPNVVTGVSDSGWTLSGKMTVSNPNDWEDITLTSLTDVVDNGGLCTVAVGPYVIPKSGSLEVAYSCTYSSASALSGKNTATATWDKAVAFTPAGTASAEKAFTLSQLGATNKTVTVTDSLGGTLGTVTATDSAPFASKSFTYSHDFTGVGGTCTNYDNTAKITETNQSASKTVTVCVAKDLAVSKTATPTFTRTYLWDISKSVDKTQVTSALATVTFNYTVQINQTGVTDSAWKATGVITVTNPNDWEAITVNVTDAVNNGGSCTVTGGNNVSIPASGSGVPSMRRLPRFSTTTCLLRPWLKLWRTTPVSARGLSVSVLPDTLSFFSPGFFVSLIPYCVLMRRPSAHAR
jgi:hypothetical protein